MVRVSTWLAVSGLILNIHPKSKVTQYTKFPPTNIQQITHAWYAFAAASPKFNKNTVIECFTVEFAVIGNNAFDMKLQINVNLTTEYMITVGIFNSNKIFIENIEPKENEAVEMLKWKNHELLMIRQKQKSNLRLGIFSREIKPSFNITELLQCLSSNRLEMFNLVNNRNCETLQD